MKVKCQSCRAAYDLPDEKLPIGKLVSFKCKKCGEKIRLDLRNKQTFPVENIREHILGDVEELPPFPQVVIKTQELISQSDIDLEKIAEVVETDPSIAAKLLKLSNSAYYGYSGTISSTNHAAVVLGYKTIGEIVALAGAQRALDKTLPGYGYESGDFWRHTLAVAIGAKIIAERTHKELASEAHTAGLIHDVGKIILDSYIADRKNEFETFMDENEKSFFEAEDHFFGFNHSDIAFDVGQKWNFPHTINTAIKHHHQPSKSDSDILSHILHLADYIAILSGIGYDEDDILYEFEEETLAFLGLNHDNTSDIMTEMTHALNKMED